MRTRRAKMAITWNGVAMESALQDACTSATYTDPAEGEADSLDISINDPSGLWIGAWLPVKGDTLAASIVAEHWAREGDTRVLPCGLFTLDSFSFSGPPISGSFSAVSVPADGAFRETKRTKTWDQATLQGIGAEIAKRAGVSLVWNVPGGGIPVPVIEQSEQTDCAFFTDVCTTYGLSTKVYASKLVVHDREAEKLLPAVATIDKSEIISWSWQSDMAGTYTGGEFSYTDPYTEEDIVAKVGSGTRILKQSGSADNLKDAERKITAAVQQANHGATSMSVDMMGTANLVATQCVNVTGLGALSGKYYIDKITHNIGGGYKMSLELSKAEEVIQ